MRRLLFLLLPLLFPAFTSCGKIDLAEDMEENPTEQPDAPSVPATGDTLTVVQALAAREGESVIIRGYIVGYTDGNTLKNAVFGCPDTKANSNMLLADSPAETDIARCLPVFLNTTGEYSNRDALNLYDNPALLATEILIYGQLETYFGVNGIRKIISYELSPSPPNTVPTYTFPGIDHTPAVMPEGR